MPLTARPKTTLKLKRKASDSGAFSNLDIQENDSIHFLGNGEIEVVRGGQVVCRARCDYLPNQKPLQKKAYADQFDMFGGSTGVDKEGNPVEPRRKAPAQKSESPKANTDESAKPKSSSNLPPGARWITVHPHEGEKGVPILIQEHKDGSASVIGGAGGKLNHLKLNQMRSPGEWKARAEERKQKREEREAKRREALGEEGQEQEDAEKAKAKEHHQSKRQSNALETIEYLEQHGIEHGLSQEHIEALKVPPAPDAAPEEVKAWRKLTSEAVKTAKKIQDAYVHKLTTDHEARAAARLGDEAIGETGNKLIENRSHTAADFEGNEISRIEQLPDGRWLVRSQDEHIADETYDSWEDAAKRHAGNVLEADNGNPSQPDDFYNAKTWIREHPEEALPEGFVFKAEAAAGLAQLTENRKDIDRANKNAIKAIEQGSAFDATGYELGAVTETPTAALENLEEKAKTLADAFTNHDFNLLVDQVDADGLKKHAEFGGYAKLAEISSDVLKQNVLDRGLVDAIGYNNAAKLLAYHLAQNLSDAEYEQVVAAQHAYHSRVSTEMAAEASDKAKPLLDKIQGLHDRMLALESAVGEGEYTPQQQIEMDNLAYESEQLHKSVQKILGSTLGQLQASAAVSAALMGKVRSLDFNTSKQDLSQLIPQSWGQLNPSTIVDNQPPKPSIFDAYGLTPDDLDLFDGPDGQIARVKESGLQKLADGAYTPEDREAYERAIAIKRGDHDEDHFLPKGFAYRLKSTFTDVETEKNQFDTKLDVAEGMSDDQLESAVRSYLGARVANGDNPLDVRTDLFSPQLYNQLGLTPEMGDRVRAAVDQLDRQLISGNRVSDSAVIRAYQELGDAEAVRQKRSRKTDDLDSLHKQNIDHESGIEAAHRTLAAMPMARAAMKPLGDLNARERRYLREFAITQILGEELEERSPNAKEEPQETAEVQYDLFGNPISAAEVAAGQREDNGPELNQWQRFSKLMGGDAKAYEAVRDRLKGQFLNRFASAYGAIAGQPILTGQQKLEHVERLLIAQLPEDKRQEMLDFIRSRQQSDVAKVRSRAGGKFARELDSEWLEKYQDIKGDNRQMSLLTADAGRTEAIDWQRTTLGENAEAQLESVLAQVMPNFEQLGSAVNLYPEVNWAGKFAAHQRGLKFLRAQKKIGIHFSAGAGKSAMMLGAFSDLHSTGDIKKAIVAVPSSIIGQMVGECATFLEAGKYKYNGNLGWSREQRLGALTDDTHVHVTTRESLANDLLHLVEKHTGVKPDHFQTEKGAMDADGNELPGTTEDERRELMHKALKAEGIDPSSLMLSVDEAHDIARRKGVAASKRSLALDALAYHSSHYIHATGTPLKNDVSEIYDFLQKVAPEKFTDRTKFLATYGQDTEASQRALQRILAPYAYSVAVKPDGKDGRTLDMRHEKPRVPLSEHQASERSRILRDYETVQNWYSTHLKQVTSQMRETGQTRPLKGSDFAHAWQDEEVKAAVERLASVETYGRMSDEEKQQAIGGQIMAAPAMRNTAMNRLLHRTPFEQNAKAQHLVNMAQDHVANGRPGVIFSASSEAAAMLRDEMAKKGIRVGLIDGSLSAEQKTAERLKFSPGKGVEPETDILICTDAAQTGLNLQRGKFLVHYDVPLTQKAWDQRSARIYRRGQTDDVEVTTLMADAPEEEVALARMERKGRESRIFQGHSSDLGPSEILDDTGLAGEIMSRRNAA